jgi:hypothetical protein
MALIGKHNTTHILTDTTGKHYAIITPDKKYHKATLVIKRIKCGRGCSKCPHGLYKYICWKDEGKLKWKYIGKAEPKKKGSKNV